MIKLRKHQRLAGPLLHSGVVTRNYVSNGCTVAPVPVQNYFQLSSDSWFLIWPPPPGKMASSGIPAPQPCLWETALCYKCTVCGIFSFRFELRKSGVNLIKFPKFPSFNNIINSKRNGIVGGKLVGPAIPCRVCFWPATRERLPAAGLDNLKLFSVYQVQAWECFQVFTYSVYFLLFRTVCLQ